MKTIHAVYESGVFRPLETVELPERTEVEFEPRPVAQRKIATANWTAFTPYWASATNPANTMWPPATMSTSHDRVFGHGWSIGRLG